MEVKAEDIDFDNLDAVLNFESKEFNTLVSTMDHILSFNEKKAVEAPTTQSQNQETTTTKELDSSQMAKDKRLSEEFLEKSVTAVVASLFQLVDVTLNAMKAEATVGQLHRLSGLSLVSQLGSLLKLKVAAGLLD